ncbi:MAG: xylulokinase, partial [Verrucomicrobiota bacterium]
MIFLGIDSGTQSTKTIALDEETGAILAQAQQAYDLIDGLPPGHLEQEPSDWIAAVEATIGSCLKQLGPRKSEVAGIGVSGQQHGLVVLDAEDRPVRPAKLWCDTSTTAQCDEFSAAFGGASGLLELAGNAILPGYTVPKLLWLKQNEAENFARTASVLLPHDYINFWLTGIKRMEYGDASGTGLLDVRKREWCGPLVDFTDERVAAMLPELGSSTVWHGPLKKELTDRWGLGEVHVSAGGGDNMMGAIGTGNVKPGVITASLGTSGTLYGAAEKPVIDPHGEVAAFCDSADHWMPLVCTMNVTVLTESVRDLFSWELSELENAVGQTEPGAGGLAFLPYLNGERTPNLPDGKAVLHGLTSENFTSGNMARAAMEGVTLGLGYGLQRFKEQGMKPTEIRLTGGGSNSPTWRQILADIFDAETVCLQTAEGAALGSAIQAAACHAGGGQFDDAGLESLTGRLIAVDEDSRCRQVSENVSKYGEMQERFNRLSADLHA